MKEYIILLRVVSTSHCNNGDDPEWRKGNFHMSPLWHHTLKIRSFNCSELNRKRGLSIRHYPHALWHEHVKVNVHIYRCVYTLFRQLLVTKVHLMCFGSSLAASAFLLRSSEVRWRTDNHTWNNNDLRNQGAKLNPDKKRLMLMLLCLIWPDQF